jgi:hypothetical protein
MVLKEQEKQEENEVEEVGKSKKRSRIDDEEIDETVSWNSRIIFLPKLFLQAQQTYLYEY